MIHIFMYTVASKEDVIIYMYFKNINIKKVKRIEFYIFNYVHIFMYTVASCSQCGHYAFCTSKTEM